MSGARPTWPGPRWATGPTSRAPKPSGGPWSRAARRRGPWTALGTWTRETDLLDPCDAVQRVHRWHRGGRRIRCLDAAERSDAWLDGRTAAASCSARCACRSSRGRALRPRASGRRTWSGPPGEAAWRGGVGGAGAAGRARRHGDPGEIFSLSAPPERVPGPPARGRRTASPSARSWRSNASGDWSSPAGRLSPARFFPTATSPAAATCFAAPCRDGIGRHYAGHDGHDAELTKVEATRSRCMADDASRAPSTRCTDAGRATRVRASVPAPPARPPTSCSRRARRTRACAERSWPAPSSEGDSLAGGVRRDLRTAGTARGPFP